MSRRRLNEKSLDQELSDPETVDFPTDNIALLFGEVTQEKAAQVVSWIIANNLSPNQPEELALLISSQGGDASAAFSIIETMKSSRIPIRTIGLGEICSAGLLIFTCGTKKRRVLTPTCSVMSHHFSNVAEGAYHELLNLKKDWEFMHKKVLDIYMMHTGKSEAYIMKHLLNTLDAWLTPEEALKHKLADKIETESYFLG